MYGRVSVLEGHKTSHKLLQNPKYINYYFFILLNRVNCLKYQFYFNKALFSKMRFYILCTWMLACTVYGHHLHVLCSARPAKDVRVPGTSVTDSCEPSCVGTWNWTVVHWESKKVLLTAKPSLHINKTVIKKKPGAKTNCISALLY